MINKKQGQFEINEYRYHLVGSSLTCVVWARSRETADKIIAIVNTDAGPDWIFVPKRLGFCKRFRTDVPPYELEQEQMESAEENLRCWRKHLKERQNEEIQH